MDLEKKDAPEQEDKTVLPESAPLAEDKAAEPWADKAAGKGRVRNGILAGMAVLVLAGLAAAWIFLSSAPPALTDGAALDQLPAGAEILSRHEESSGRVQVLEYAYVEEHPFCAVERTQRQPFRYAKGVWTAEGEPETVNEREDWSALAGLWTEQAAGPGARYVRVRVDSFDGETLRGSVFYIDPSGSSRADTAESFQLEQSAGGTYMLTGTGYFRYNYLHLDRDLGVCFDNDCVPMEQTDGGGKAPDFREAGRHTVIPTPTPAPTEIPAEAPAA